MKGKIPILKDHDPTLLIGVLEGERLVFKDPIQFNDYKLEPGVLVKEKSNGGSIKYVELLEISLVKKFKEIDDEQPV